MSYSLLGAHANATVGGMPEVIAAWKPPLVVVLDHSDVWHQVKAASPKTTFVGRVYIPYQPDFNNPDLPPIQTARDHCTQVLPWAERMGSTYSFWQGVNEPIVNSHEAMQRYSDFEAERARIIVGAFPRQGITLTVTDPWNNSTSIVSGSKPEYGAGGFEVLAPNVATYTLTFLDQRFQVTTQDGVTFLTFAETQAMLLGEEDKLDQILARLDQIIAILQEKG